ncbi:hypothetical protein llap_701 [Limosa lapponica baueri]|uniref:Uncharacterized protein n=1 Tax=Limosa lapponica baueri TaxID=1758121 RepID=A0A2I0USP6_LIMLA|nr:hypothetical protein llap_701 [Limosa lapponica baueri]
MGFSSVVVGDCTSAFFCLTANCVLSGGRGYRPPGQLHVTQPADAEDGEEGFFLGLSYSTTKSSQAVGLMLRGYASAGKGSRICPACTHRPGGTTEFVTPQGKAVSSPKRMASGGCDYLWLGDLAHTGEAEYPAQSLSPHVTTM